MRLSISNIGWSAESDSVIYDYMRKLGFTGLEIAPTRVLPDNPYEKLITAKKWSDCLNQGDGFVLPSMQSIWFGRTENLFGSTEEKTSLIEYTQKAIDFAETIGCKNLVFGCPKNRSMPDGVESKEAYPFFKELGEYAAEHNCVIAIEANPPIYNTNFINTTKQALDFISRIDTSGLRLNLDVGAMVYSREGVSVLYGYEKYISHVHISEPYLKPIEKRAIHKELASYLKEVNYKGYVSIEVGKQEDTESLFSMMDYVCSVFE